MSRIGKKSIEIPSTIVFESINNFVRVKGKNGVLEKTFLPAVKIKHEASKIIVERVENTKFARAYHGLVRVLIQNMINGIETKFIKILIVEGVGYKFQIDNNCLILNMGFTHPINFEIPQQISIKLDSTTKISISGIDKESVGEFAAKIRAIKPPEPYKGKGIRYENEKIKRKAGKTGK